MKKNAFTLLLIAGIFLLFIVPVSAVNYDVDTGFRPNVDGFSFPNYGSQVCSGYWACSRVQNLTSVEMRRMFGDKVCKTVYQDGSCDLLRVAQSWMSQVNQTMSGGHCEGMAVLSSLFYSDIQSPTKYGARGTNGLQIENNSALQRELAYWFATQWFMDGHLIENDPTTQLKLLVRAFQEAPNKTIPIGIYKRDMTGGHAITAYAVEDRGDGIYWVMVYDNNYPNEERHITVDTNRNTWTYKSATMSGLAQDVYDGSGKRNPFQLSPVDSRLDKFACDFCPPSATPNYDTQRQPSSPAAPDSQPSGGDSIYDLLMPWLFPDSQQPVSPTAVPTAAPAVPRAPDSGSSDSLIDLLLPMLFPELAQPTAAPIAAPTRTPVVLPTAEPKPDTAPATKDFNKIMVNKDINIYIETDANQRAGYDWQDGNTYSGIPGVTVNRSPFRSTAKIPTNLKYYLWINTPDQIDSDTVFDTEITSLGTVLKLNNMMASYTEPNFVYNPPDQSNRSGVRYEAFEIMANPKHLPRVEFTISDKNGEYNFLFVTSVDGALADDLPLDFVIYHDYDYSQIGIWITTAKKNQTGSFKNASFDVNGEFYLWDDQNERYISTKESPISLDINGMFFFNYKNWLDGSGYFISADIDGSGDFETWREIR